MHIPRRAPFEAIHRRVHWDACITSTLLRRNADVGISRRHGQRTALVNSSRPVYISVHSDISDLGSVSQFRDATNPPARRISYNGGETIGAYHEARRRSIELNRPSGGASRVSRQAMEQLYESN